MVLYLGQVMPPVLPSAHAPVAQPDGKVTPAWHRFFNSLTVGPQPAQAHTLPASPYTLAASSKGSVVVSGGAVSLIQLTRGLITVNLGVTSGMFPAAVGDVFVITYTVAPTVTFLPG